MSIQSRLGHFLAFIGRSVVWSVHLGTFGYTVLIYYLLARLPLEHWTASMLMITLPVAWLVLILLGIFWLFSRPWRSLLSVVGLVLGFWLWPRTVGFHTPQPNQQGLNGFTLLSYNVSVFGLELYYEDPKQPNTRQSRGVTDFVVSHPAAVKCFQEFYTGNEQPLFQMRRRLEAKGYGYHAFLPPNTNGYIGVATFSRYPILRQGSRAFSSFNGMVWTDIKIGPDTVRIINVHMQSMGIRVRRLFRERAMAGVKSETRSVLGALKAGFKARQGEVRIVEERIANSPYPVVVTGDFNDTPYSVVYERLRRRLTNAFEAGGHGFGFTLNRAPRTIRIDNQFFDNSRLELLDFITHRDQPYSDHFPIEGRYVFRK